MPINVNLPSFYEDKFYDPTQTALLGAGQGALAGETNEFYQELYEPDTAKFENVLRNISRDVTQRTEESAVARGVGRGGVVGSQVSKAVADVEAPLRWQQYMDVLNRKENLYGRGLETISGVRGAGLQYQQQRNQFALNKAQLETDIGRYNEIERENKAARKTQLWSDILSSGIGAAANVYEIGMLTKKAGATTAPVRGSAEK